MKVNGIEVEVHYVTQQWPATVIYPVDEKGMPVAVIYETGSAEYGRCTRCWLGVQNNERAIAAHAVEAHFEVKER